MNVVCVSHLAAFGGDRDPLQAYTQGNAGRTQAVLDEVASVLQERGTDPSLVVVSDAGTVYVNKAGLQAVFGRIVGRAGHSDLAKDPEAMQAWLEGGSQDLQNYADQLAAAQQNQRQESFTEIFDRYSEEQERLEREHQDLLQGVAGLQRDCKARYEEMLKGWDEPSKKQADAAADAFERSSEERQQRFAEEARKMYEEARKMYEERMKGYWQKWGEEIHNHYTANNDEWAHYANANSVAKKWIEEAVKNLKERSGSLSDVERAWGHSLLDLTCKAEKGAAIQLSQLAVKGPTSTFSDVSGSPLQLIKKTRAGRVFVERASDQEREILEITLLTLMANDATTLLSQNAGEQERKSRSMILFAALSEMPGIGDGQPLTRAVLDEARQNLTSASIGSELKKMRERTIDTALLFIDG